VRVLLDTTVARRGPSGTAVYITQLAAALRDEGIEVVEAANARRRWGGGLRSPRAAASELAWTQRSLRRRAHGVDVVHHPLPALTVAGPAPQVVTVHDLAVEALPGAFDRRFAAYVRAVQRRAARRAAAVVVPSQATAAELREHWGVEDNVVVAPHGPGQELAVRRGEPRHLLYVGDDEPRKDLPTLLAAYAAYRAAAADPLPLVLAGAVRARGEGVRIVARPDAAALAQLYAHARALVHPSRHEGFGLTVLEALRAGTPVIAADTPAVREVAGEQARYVAPGDPAALAAALADPPGTPDPDRAAAFTWQRSARLHIEAYRLAGRC
jgi:glycosyltransferase involved in cell wall biosynthesis